MGYFVPLNKTQKIKIEEEYERKVEFSEISIIMVITIIIIIIIISFYLYTDS